MRILLATFCALALAVAANDSALGQGKPADSKALESKRMPKAGPAMCFTFPKQSYKHLDGHRLVIVVNGVAGSTAASDTLMDLNSEYCLGLKIRPVSWTRHDSICKDYVDHDAQLSTAARIACEVALIRKDAPNAKIFLVGHSAGTRIVLAAAEMMPPQSVERIILLASAVSSCYDLTTALKTSRLGIDNFYSPEDGVLAFATEEVGTADGLKGHVAGRTGFRLASSDKKTIEAYRNLRQYRWNEDLAGSGGHYSWTRQHNMKRCIVPLFFIDQLPPAVASAPAKGPSLR